MMDHHPFRDKEVIKLYPIPNGGIHAVEVIAIAAARMRQAVEIVHDPGEADVFVDDIQDSGCTAARYLEEYPTKVFVALHNKRDGEPWVVFPWEQYERNDGPEDAVRRILQFIGEDPDRDGLKETPKRVLKSYGELFAGYSQSPRDILKTFDNIPADEIVMLDRVEFYSTCEHHMMPFVGTCSVAYLPDGDRVVGLSKLARLVEVFARRLQVQERLTSQITTSLMHHLKPRGAACYIEAKHFCVCSRGVGKQNSVMKTSSLQGLFREDHAVRAEFFSMISR